MTSPVPAATVKASVLVKFSAERLIDLTNIDKPAALVVDNAVLDKAIVDGEYYFLGEVGEDSDDKYHCDLLALDYCAMYILCRNVPLLTRYEGYYKRQADWEIEKCMTYRENFNAESATDSEVAGKKTVFHTQGSMEDIIPSAESTNT